MPSLKEYRNRITSVKSTRKITSAMKMVAASKLRRAQEKAQASQPYAASMSAMVSRLSAGLTSGVGAPRLLVGTGASQVHLLVVMTADRGLCGGFNANLLRFARQHIKALLGQGKQVKILTVGRKARDILRRDYAAYIIHSVSEVGKGKGQISFAEADAIAATILAEFDAGHFDVCTLIYNQFKNVLVQKPSAHGLIPLALQPDSANDNVVASAVPVTPYEFEPSEDQLLASLLPRNLAVQIFRAMLDSAAGEQAARMTAMDNATRNAGDMIKKLSLQYNRARQAYITKELIEIISGAEAV